MDWPEEVGRDRRPDASAVASPQRRALSYADLSVGERLGSGGQAAVHEATVDGDRVAVKEPATRTTLSVDELESFTDEAEVWANLDQRERTKPRWEAYEHVVGLVDWGTNPSPWIAMEYMDGGSLEGRLEAFGTAAPLEEVLWTAWAVTRGVELAHSYGVAHLDLKPANVLFREVEGAWAVPKVGDWGLARVLAEQSGSIDALSVRYAAPEQIEPEEFGDPDTLTDVYQVGALTYAMLTGRPPYEGPRSEITRGVLEEEPPDPPSDHRPDLPADVDDVVLTALATEKRDRYRTVEHLQEALVDVAIDLPPSGHRHGTPHTQADEASGPADADATDDDERTAAEIAGAIEEAADEPADGDAAADAATTTDDPSATDDASTARGADEPASEDRQSPDSDPESGAERPDDDPSSASLLETGRRLLGRGGDDGSADDDEDVDDDWSSADGDVVGASERLVDDEESMVTNYAALLLHAADSEITLASLDAVLEAARVGIGPSRARAWVTVIQDESIEALGDGPADDPYVYAALLLDEAGTPIEQERVTDVLSAASAHVEEARVTALLEALEDVDIEEVLEE